MWTANEAVTLAWWPHTKKPDPLQAVATVADCLERGQPVPPAEAALFAKALRNYLGGHTDITDNLGLRPRRGGRYEAPAIKALRAARDETIRSLYQSLSGNKTRRSRTVAALLSAPLDRGQVTEAEVFRHLQELHEHHGNALPTSARQVMRVVRDL